MKNIIVNSKGEYKDENGIIHNISDTIEYKWLIGSLKGGCDGITVPGKAGYSATERLKQEHQPNYSNYMNYTDQEIQNEDEKFIKPKNL